MLFRSGSWPWSCPDGGIRCNGIKIVERSLSQLAKGVKDHTAARNKHRLHLLDCVFVSWTLHQWDCFLAHSLTQHLLCNYTETLVRQLVLHTGLHPMIHLLMIGNMKCTFSKTDDDISYTLFIQKQKIGLILRVNKQVRLIRRKKTQAMNQTSLKQTCVRFNVSHHHATQSLNGQKLSHLLTRPAHQTLQMLENKHTSV